MIEKKQIKLGDAKEEPELNAKELFHKAVIPLNEKLRPAPIAISIGQTEYKGSLYPTPYGSYGDFSAIVGASKSKKTFFKSMLMACYLGFKFDKYTDELIRGHDTNDKLVIDIDTEQSDYHSQRVFKRVTEMCGYEPPTYTGIALRKFSPKERLQVIEWLFCESEMRSNLGLVSIDGVADLVDDINDLKQCNEVVNKLMKWSHDTSSHIITVIHRNFGTNKPTGHLGSAILKKAETSVFVEKNEEDDSVLLKPEYTRNIAFDNLTFEVRNDWLPYLIPSDEISKASQTKAY